MSRVRLPQNVSAALQELRQALQSFYGERLGGLYLYGSYARGAIREGSDVDVLIVLRGQVAPASEIDRISEAVSALCTRHGLLISTFPVPVEWYRDRQSPFFLNVRREAVAV